MWREPTLLLRSSSSSGSFIASLILHFKRYTVQSTSICENVLPTILAEWVDACRVMTQEMRSKGMAVHVLIANCAGYVYQSQSSFPLLLANTKSCGV